MVQIGGQMKSGDKVKITAKEDDLLYIPEYSRIPILKSKSGEVYKVFKDGCEISFSIAGIWFIKSEFIKLKEV
jgi:hypothetical protein